MASRCQHCAAFSVELALELWGTSASSYDRHHSYPHYEKISDLCESATSGCDLCRLMVASLKKEPIPNDKKYYGRYDLCSYLLQKEQLPQGQHAHFKLQPYLCVGSRLNLVLEKLRLKGKLEFVNLRFRLATSRRMPLHSRVAT